MTKFKDIKKFIFLSRNNNLYGFKTLKNLIKIKKKPDLILLPVFQKNNLRTKTYIKEIFKINPNKEAIENLALLNNIRLKRIKTINCSNIIRMFKKEKFDLIFISGGWPELINKKIFNIPKYSAINIHPSNLPDFRGGDVHRWQIYKESKFTGISIHNVNENFDSGSIILKKKILLQIKNPIKLNIKLSSIAANMIKKLLNKKISPINSIKFKKKTEYYKKWNWLDKNFFYVKRKNYHNLENFVKASYNIPNNFNGPYIKLNKKKFIIRSCRIKTQSNKLFDGNFYLTRNNLVLKTNKKKRLCYVNKIQFIDGYNWKNNEVNSKIIYKNFNRYFNEKNK